jgi:hypothetical protein
MSGNETGAFGTRFGAAELEKSAGSSKNVDVSEVCLAHVPAKRIRFADKDMRQHQNLRRFPVISE